MFGELFQNGLCQLESLFILTKFIVFLLMNGVKCGVIIAQGVSMVSGITKMFLKIPLSFGGSSLFAFMAAQKSALQEKMQANERGKN